MPRKHRAWLASVAFAFAAQDPAPTSPAPVKVSEVRVMMSEQGPVVLLSAKNRVVPIFVDDTVAASIQASLSNEPLARPLSHDLMKTIIDAYAGKVTRVSIRLKDSVFYADLTVAVNGAEKIFDSRSSDAIALAVRFEAPIYLTEELIEEVGQMMPGVERRSL